MTEPSKRPLPLPTVFAHDPVMPEFAERVALMLEPFSRALEDFPRLLDAWRTDTTWLDWLSQITGAPGTAQWDEAARRAAIESAAALAARRGTHEALMREAALLGWELSVSDPGQVTTTQQPATATPPVPRRPLVVALAWPQADTVRLVTARPQLDAMVRRHCPAHVPYTTVVAEGFTPSAAMTLPANWAKGQPRTVFFYGPHPDADQTVGYDLSAPAPVPGARRLDTRWEGLDELREEGDTFKTGEIHGAACYPESGFYLISHEKVATWDRSAQKFTRISKLTDVFPELPKRAGAGSITHPAVDDILSVTSGSTTALYVFSGEHSYCYARPGAKPDKQTIADRYTSDLPPVFHRDLDAVVEDPYRNVHYLISGPQCAEIEGFTYKATHLIRDIWPGLPVRTTTEQTGGGALNLATLIPLNTSFKLTYFTRTHLEGAQILLLEGPKKTLSQLMSIKQSEFQILAPGESGSITLPKEALKSPGTYTLYYMVLAFNRPLADPVEFTAILDSKNYGRLGLADGGDSTLREKPRFTCQTPYATGATLAMYSTYDQASNLSQEDKEIPPVTFSKPIKETDNEQKVETEETFTPGPYKAYLLARDGHAFLAEPLDITLTLASEKIGKLNLGGTRANNTDGTIPQSQSLTISYTPNAQENWPKGTLHVYRQTAKDADPNKLPEASPLCSYRVEDLTQPFAVKDSLMVGSYTAYFCTGKAWLAHPKRFTITAPIDSGSLTLETPSSKGTSNILTYATRYQDDGNQIVVFPLNDGKPAFNTNASKWEGCVYSVPAQLKQEKITITAANLAPASHDVPVVPGTYRVHFVTGTGAPLAQPIEIDVTLGEGQLGTLTVSPEHPETAIKVERPTPINLKYTAGYLGYSNRITITAKEGGLIYEKSVSDKKGDLDILESDLKSGNHWRPGAYVVNFCAADRVIIAKSRQFIVNASTNDGEITLPGTSPRIGEDFTIGYKTEFPQTEGYPARNRIEIYRKGDSVNCLQKLDTQGTSGNVTAKGLEGGDYQICFLGKDDSSLATPKTLNVQPRTVTLRIVDNTYDSWTASVQNPLSCSVGSVKNVTARPSGGSAGELTTITFTQGKLADQLSATLDFKPTEKNQETGRKLTIEWTMQTKDNSVTYKYSGSDGLTASFAVQENIWGHENPLTLPRNTIGTGPDSQVWVALSNNKHRTFSTTIINNLPFAFNIEETPVATNANAISGDSKPANISANDRNTFTYAIQSSDAEASGGVKYKFTRLGSDKEEHLALRWYSHPGEGGAKCKFESLPHDAKIEGDRDALEGE
ncbi:phage tail protein [Streptomyces noursei]|uniref:phage tail protein n=1 Tax=Streptomyces noursei TaxID=1971 RepID=UPI000C9B1E05|nr:phage tail protein [Streptomyces noursei]